MNPLGIMQGRLLPPEPGRFQAFPRSRWEAEFPAAAAAGLATIEWIYDVYGAEVNPIGTDAGVERIRELSRQTGVAVRSVCADYFMDEAFVRTSDDEFSRRLAHLEWLLERCAALGITRAVLPFVDQSAILTEQDRGDVVRALEQALPAAERFGVELHLETALGPGEFRALLDRVPHPLVKVNYDSGNSSSLGYRSQHEFSAYGDRIGSVHIKDRLLGGGTVPLGTGSAVLPDVVAGLKALKYAGDVILQVARGKDGEEVEWMRANRLYVERLWGDAA